VTSLLGGDPSNTKDTGVAVLGHLTVARDHRASTPNVAHHLVTVATQHYDHLVRHSIRIVKGLTRCRLPTERLRVTDPDDNRIDVGQPR
jgi:hypothetical protein